MMSFLYDYHFDLSKLLRKDLSPWPWNFRAKGLKAFALALDLVWLKAARATCTSRPDGRQWWVTGGTDGPSARADLTGCRVWPTRRPVWSARACSARGLKPNQIQGQGLLCCRPRSKTTVTFLAYRPIPPPPPPSLLLLGIYCFV